MICALPPDVWSLGYFEKRTETTLPPVLQVCPPPLEDVPPLELVPPLLEVPPELLVPPLLEVPPELLVPPLLDVPPLELVPPLLLVPPLELVVPPLLEVPPELPVPPLLPPLEPVFELPVVGGVVVGSEPPYGPPSGVTLELHAG